MAAHKKSVSQQAGGIELSLTIIETRSWESKLAADSLIGCENL